MPKIYDIKKVPPEKGYYIAGFVDGEGSFFLTARPRKDYSSGWKFSGHFNVSNSDKLVLEICRKYLGCGKIRESRQGFYTLEVSSRVLLKRFILPFFRRFGFLSNKKKHEFQVFQKTLQLLEHGIHTQNDLENILVLRTRLNEFRKKRITHSDDIIRETFVFSPLD
uniref:Putative site-specific DNA endonuclease n=1 Tax=Dicloster acuatus TaxID=91190 RepID=A0A097KQI3_9CHLO|nr:putative site-specific DNA endonuclease [Dicloster acuatus]YP_009106657.1 putative site-specific DNA endonuclease [Dicloster acuatus]AIT95464.1 putative site-specific DNA endonuclease [Dicloster acuatus]AIT95471.1 putative site-specific DNA endonuclease [Dicloster acuatus]